MPKPIRLGPNWSRQASRIVFALAATLLAHSLAGPRQVALAVGLGEKLLLEEGSLLEADFRRDSHPDSIFAANGLWGAAGELRDARFVALARQLQVDVVAPGRELLKMMNEVSTRSRAMFLQDFERFYKTLRLGSVSRPMLLTYLGLEFVQPDQMASWYAAHKRRLGNKILESCKRLLVKRDHLSGSAAEPEAEQELARIVDEDRSNKFHLAHLMFVNNLHLFMLENYLLLCSRLEPDRLAAELKQSRSLLARRNH